METKLIELKFFLELANQEYNGNLKDLSKEIAIMRGC
jgi:hypothetical protein